MSSQPPPHQELGLRPLALDVRHAPVPLFRCHRVGHGVLFQGLKEFVEVGQDGLVLNFAELLVFA